MSFTESIRTDVNSGNAPDSRVVGNRYGGEGWGLRHMENFKRCMRAAGGPVRVGDQSTCKRPNGDPPIPVLHFCLHLAPGPTEESTSGMGVGGGAARKEMKIGDRVMYMAAVKTRT